jgi:hypothetical protein
MVHKSPKELRKHNSFWELNQGNAEETKEDNKEKWNHEGSPEGGKHKEWNRDEF